MLCSYKAFRCVQVLLIFCWVSEHPLGSIQGDVLQILCCHHERDKTSPSEIKEILIYRLGP